MGRLFGTDGVRGVANTELTGEMAYQLGRAGAYVLTKEKKHAPRILVAMDTRISGDMLESALVAGICSVGAHAVIAGVIPTPAVAYLVRHYRLDAGVMISASHNPVEYNGIKFFSDQGYKLSDELEDEIEDIVLSRMEVLPCPTGNGIGTRGYAEEALDDYIAFLRNSTTERFQGIKVALDCANGAAYKAAPITMLELGAQLCIIHNEPDGTNINDKCGSTHMEDLVALVKENGADIGFAFDGDADRCLAVDENGQVIDGDKILAICGCDMKARGELKKDTIVGTVMSNLGLTMMGRENEISVLQTNVGDRYVLESMLAEGYNLGGEQSGHIIFLDYNSTGDGVLTAIQLLSVMNRSGKKASELGKTMEVMPQVLVNARVNNARKNEYMEVPEIKAAIEALQEKFSSDGRVLIRTSGTEPLVRVMIEGKDKEAMEKEAMKLAAFIEEKLQ
ncbi:phosphoglucosamine mutase [Anaerotignum propionicum]|uniref:Phosphoglucosamine mutase n=1 Tax=Anaerotignum propionicum DSM 1682 TaxID=991789 RepID=A0A110A7R6_ANAPI|nr:phosphoglucosamine mutase [Anaerotignum propionicum]AMJ42502.1 phosphoglucosamine mutase [Anaerotignum propionicum DSM 1682]SHE32970.1 phosphoglucosamine mutase [[Clostridium] propionicum DSM 1682] [Anaerotignum propionicum DSM 1682]